MGNDTNSLPDILELLLRVVPSKGRDKGFDVAPELRITKGFVEGEDDLCFEVALKRVFLYLHLDGLDPISGTRFGEPLKDNSAEVKRKTSHEVVKEGEAHGRINMALDPSKIAGSLSAGAEAKAAAKTVQSTTAIEKISHLKVKARPNLKWEVTESTQLDELDGTYLEGLDGDPLCKVVAKKGANSKALGLVAVVKQRDVILRAQKESRLIRFRNATQEKMMKILISRALSGSENKFNGVIDFSRSEIEIEDQHST
jgi:hypothetical protein